MSKPVQTVTYPTDFAIEVSHITKTFEQWQRSEKMRNLFKNLIKPDKRTITALDDVSFTVERGEFVAYAGANGAGKSTTMKLLCGMLMPKCGDITILGMSPKKDRIRLMRRMGILFGNRTELWWDHPVIQSFEWKRVVWDIDKADYDRMLEKLTRILDLEGILHTCVRELSLGQRMKADLALMLLHEPEVILLDEPTIGLDVLAKRQMITFLKEFNRQEGTTILVTSHDMDDLEEMTRRILLISGGKIAFDGGFEALRVNTGTPCRIILTLEGSRIPDLLGAKLVSSEDGICEYEVDTTRVPMQKILSQVSALPDVADIELRKAPIEEVIAGLYRKWKEA